MRLLQTCCVGLATLLVIVAALPLAPTPAAAGGRSDYYVEFRSRMGTPIGHSYIVLSHRGKDGKLRQKKSAGFYVPDDPVRFLQAVFSSAPAVIRASPRDRIYRTRTTYRVKLSADAYRRLERFVERNRRKPPRYSLFGTNCNSFVAAAARKVGLKAPANTNQLPPTYVTQLKALNSRAGGPAADTRKPFALPRPILQAP